MATHTIDLVEYLFTSPNFRIIFIPSRWNLKCLYIEHHITDNTRADFRIIYTIAG